MIESYIVSWQDYGQERRRTVKYHLDRLKTLLLPTNVELFGMGNAVADEGADHELERGQGGQCIDGGVGPQLHQRIACSPEGGLPQPHFERERHLVADLPRNGGMCHDGGIPHSSLQTSRRRFLARRV